MVAIRRILIPTDFSEPALAALDYGRTLAGQFGAELHLLHVVPAAQVGWATEGTTMNWPRFQEELEADGRAKLAKLGPPADPFFTAATREVVTGTPVDEILAYTAAHGIDLIVMGTHGRGLVGHMFLGSVAERVVRRAAAPVLTVHATRLAATSKAAVPIPA